jgi:uncharacterized membrane protein YedE/YeeE
MGKSISALLAGIVFGLGLTISQMLNPAKVLAFLDILGNWDPSLALVMGGALLVTAIGYRLVWTRVRPVFSERFQVPDNRTVDTRLAVGAVLFGMGWGLVGLCPGPAISALTVGGLPVLTFMAAMMVGMGLYEAVEQRAVTVT